MPRNHHQVRPGVMVLVAMCVLTTAASHLHAVGWDRDDFIISGAPNFPDRIGVFDHDFTFKGYLDQNFFGVQGMDFDAHGRLVAVSSLMREVRVYDDSGMRIGGFTQAGSPMLVEAGDVKVTSSGNYVLGTILNGAREFSPSGAFVRQYGDGDSRGVAVVPAERLWSGGNSNTVNIFDLNTGALVGSFGLGQQGRASSMQFSPATNTVLLIDSDRDAGGVFERDLNGALLQQFRVPIPQTNCNGATRGPGGDVFGTTNDFFADVVHWRPDTTVVRTIDVYPVQITAVRILWAGIVPEPSNGVVLALSSVLLVARSRARLRTKSRSL